MEQNNRGIFAACLAIGATTILGCSSIKADAVSGATKIMSRPVQVTEEFSPDILLVLESAEDGATAKIARSIAGVLAARIISVDQAKTEKIQDYALIGFGSGIFSQQHHPALLARIDSLPEFPGTKAFIFSTSGMSRQFAFDHGTEDFHTPLREKLQLKGFTIVGEFNCEGFNDNSFLKIFGGMNKGRPNEEDLGRARIFARELKKITDTAQN